MDAVTEATATGRAAKPPTASGGVVEVGFEPLAEAFRRLMARGPRGGALVVRAGDRVLADLSIGWEDGRLRRWRRETQALGFSATKGLAAMVLHRLVDRGELTYDEPVASFWPEFAAAGKGRITVRELLSHCGGLSDVQAVADGPHDLLDHLRMEERLAAAAPQTPPGQPAYHAFTFGWLAAGLARAITGKGMRARPKRARGTAQDPGPRDRKFSRGRGSSSSARLCGSTRGSARWRRRCWAGSPSRKQGFGPCMRPDSSGSVAARTPRSGGLRCLP